MNENQPPCGESTPDDVACPCDWCCWFLLHVSHRAWFLLHVSHRASPPLLSMWWCKNISHIQVIYFLNLFFGNLTHKTESGTAYMWELLIVNHLDLANQEQGFSSQIIFITLFSSQCNSFAAHFTSQIIFITLFSSQCNSFAAHFTSLSGKLRTYAGAKQNHFPEVNWHILTFLQTSF